MISDISEEQIKEAYDREEPDTKGCLHELRLRPVGMQCDDGQTRFGVVARMVEHDEDGNPIVRDFVISADVLIKISENVQASIMTLGLIATLAQAGMPSDLLTMMIDDLGGISIDDLTADRDMVPTPRGEIT